MADSEVDSKIRHDVSTYLIILTISRDGSVDPGTKKFSYIRLHSLLQTELSDNLWDHFISLFLVKNLKWALLGLNIDIILCVYVHFLWDCVCDIICLCMWNHPGFQLTEEQSKVS